MILISAGLEGLWYAVPFLLGAWVALGVLFSHRSLVAKSVSGASWIWGWASVDECKKFQQAFSEATGALEQTMKNT